MPYAHPYHSAAVRNVIDNQPSVPEYDSVVVEFRFEEGQAQNAASMNNVLFDAKSPSTAQDEEVTNPRLTGTYVGGVAPNWSADVGVTATEDTTSGGAQAQRITNCSGVGQGLQGTGLTGLTNGGVYLADIDIELISGTGNVQIQFDGFEGMTGTYDIASTDMNAGFVTNIKFYMVADATGTSSVTITSDTAAMVLEVSGCSIKELTGGNPMVMDFNVYDQSRRSTNSYDFNGTDQYFYIRDSRQTNLDLSSTYTLGVMVKPGSLAANGAVFGKWEATGNERSYTFILLSTLKTLRQFNSDDGISSNNARHVTALTIPETKFRYIGMGVESGELVGNLDEQTQSFAYGVGPPLPRFPLYNSSADCSIAAQSGTTGPAGSFYLGEIGKIVFWSGKRLTNSQHIQAFNTLRSAYGV